jgi:hypothetical protein
VDRFQCPEGQKRIDPECVMGSDRDQSRPTTGAGGSQAFIENVDETVDKTSQTEK